MEKEISNQFKTAHKALTTPVDKINTRQKTVVVVIRSEIARTSNEIPKK